MSRCWLALGWLIAPIAAFAVAPAAVLEMNAEGEVQIAPDGHVSDYRLTSELAPGVAQLVDHNVRGWQFEPVLVDGKPVIAKTHVRLRLHAEPSAQGGDQYRVRIDHVDFGGPKQSPKIHPPRYPEEAVRAHLGARVLLALKIDEQGGVADVQPYQTSLDARAASEAEAESWRHVFERACVAAARRWHFDVAETVNGKPIGTSLIVPLEFSLIDDGSRRELRNGQWKPYAPGPVHPAPWMNPTVAGADFSTLGNGEAESLDSQFRLKDDVVGSLL